MWARWPPNESTESSNGRDVARPHRSGGSVLIAGFLHVLLGDIEVVGDRLQSVVVVFRCREGHWHGAGRAVSARDLLDDLLSRHGVADRLSDIRRSLRSPRGVLLAKRRVDAGAEDGMPQV